MTDIDHWPTVQLQVNNSGAWKNVARVRWRAADMYFVREGVENIAAADGGHSRWRIATVDAIPRVLQRFDVANGWQEPTL